MSMTPTERKEAEDLLKNPLISPRAKDLIRHVLACQDPNCVRCATEWRTKPWVRAARAKDLGDAIPAATIPGGKDKRL